MRARISSVDDRLYGSNAGDLLAVIHALDKIGSRCRTVRAVAASRQRAAASGEPPGFCSDYHEAALDPRPPRDFRTGRTSRSRLARGRHGGKQAAPIRRTIEPRCHGGNSRRCWRQRGAPKGHPVDHDVSRRRLVPLLLSSRYSAAQWSRWLPRSSTMRDVPSNVSESFLSPIGL